MRINIDIDDALMAAAEEAAGRGTMKDTVEEALRLMILTKQGEVREAFGKFPCRNDLPRSRKGRSVG
jgi:Arc/MetJ family transcription regulator